MGNTQNKSQISKEKNDIDFPKPLHKSHITKKENDSNFPKQNIPQIHKKENDKFSKAKYTSNSQKRKL